MVAILLPQNKMSAPFFRAAFACIKDPTYHRGLDPQWHNNVLCIGQGQWWPLPGDDADELKIWVFPKPLCREFLVAGICLVTGRLISIPDPSAPKYEIHVCRIIDRRYPIDMMTAAGMSSPVMHNAFGRIDPGREDLHLEFAANTNGYSTTACPSLPFADATSRSARGQFY